jgi:hypothetical protein
MKKNFTVIIFENQAKHLPALPMNKFATAGIVLQCLENKKKTKLKIENLKTERLKVVFVL